MNEILAKAKANIDVKTVTSVAVGMAVFGVITFAAIRSGIKPLQTAVKVANGGK